MKRILLIAGSAMILHGAFAADVAPAQTPTTHAAPSTPASAPVSDAAAQAKAEQARKELAELRVQMQELSRKMAALSGELGEGGPRSYAMRYLGDPNRAMIGVVLAPDPKGVRLSAVTPDGPAARAGMRDGDVITAIDEQSVVDKSSDAAYRKAHTLLANLKEGQNVSVEYRRGTETGVVTFGAERREAWNWPLMLSDDPESSRDIERARSDVEHEMERNRKHVDEEVREAQHEAQHAAKLSADEMRKQVERAQREAMKEIPRQRDIVRMAMPWWGLNLAPLNADLGRYFGAKTGVLVIAADEGSLPGIRAGDVITSIAGEAVSRPEDALRALRDHESGKDVPIKVMRDRKTLALNMKAPAFNSIFNMHVPPPEPPTPPTPATPVAAPPSPFAPAAPAPPPAPSAPEHANR